jgi:hypothetical protein
MIDDHSESQEATNQGTEEPNPTLKTLFTGEYQVDGSHPWDRWIELAVAIFMACVAVGTAWSGYQASRWGGVQSVKFSEAGALRTESTRASTLGGQIAQLDAAVYMNWINAFAAEEQNLIDFYYQRFRDDFKIAVDAWLATDPTNNPDAPESPFEMPEYSVDQFEKAIRLEEEASHTFMEGKDANQQSDDYILNTVILASVLFFTGIVNRFRWRFVRILLVIIAAAMIVIGLYNLITYPVM